MQSVIGARDVRVNDAEPAVRDARVANGAAVVRYPFAMERTVVGGIAAIKDDIIEAAKASASDYVFERTGKRVVMREFQWELRIDDGVISMNVNGISPSDIGNISVPELVSETVARTTLFAANALSLLITSDTVDERLTFEGDVIGGILEGFADRGYSAPLAALETPGANRSMFGTMFGFDTKNASATASLFGTAHGSTASSGGQNPAAGAPTDDAPEGSTSDEVELSKSQSALTSTPEAAAGAASPPSSGTLGVKGGASSPPSVFGRIPGIGN